MIRRIAVGGMGEIFLARQQIAGVHRLVVLKRLLPELAEDAERLAMFVDEARIAANLAHPGIVQVHEFGEDEQGHFIVMEYVAGHHVGRVVGRAIRDGRTIPIRIGAFVMHEVARALDHAHNARDSDGTPLHIVHRDISPSNVLVSFAGDVKLMDFGIARAANRSYRTNDGSIRGKFAYMAPEQIEVTDVDAKSDVFAAGILLWELTLGRRLFDGATDFEIIRATLEQPIPRPTSIDPYYPPALEQLVMAALERPRDRRLATAADLAAGLKAYLRAQPADRDDVAALMATLFPDEAAESARLQDEPAKPGAPAPTVLLAEPATVPGQPQSVVAARARPRWPVAFALLVVVAAAAVIAVTSLGSPGRTDVIGAQVAAGSGGSGDIAVAPPAADARDVAAAAVAPSADAFDVAAVVDAAAGSAPPAPRDPGRVAAPPTRKQPPRGDPPRGVPKNEAPPDAGPVVSEHAIDDAAVAEGMLHFRAPVGHGTIKVIRPPGIRCTNEAIQTRCTGPRGLHTFTFRTGDVEFSSTLTIGPGLRYCDVDPSRKDTSCGSQ